MEPDPTPDDLEDDEVPGATDYTGPIPDDAPARQTKRQREQERNASKETS